VGALYRLRELLVNFASVRECDQDKEDVRDAELWRALLPISGTLTRLVLGRREVDYWGEVYEEHRAKAWGVEGPGLAVVGRLTCLRELVLCKLHALGSPALLEYLLPLPGSLRKLELHSNMGMGPDTAVWEGLQAAAASQDCLAFFGDSRPARWPGTWG
jgi:hypothetical protein